MAHVWSSRTIDATELAIIYEWYLLNEIYYICSKIE
jgi:hypothetical protein